MFASIRNRVSSFIAELPPVYWLLWVGTLVNRVGGFLAPFLSLYLTGDRGIPIAQAAFVVSLFGAGSFLGRIVGGALCDRTGRKPVLLLSFLVTPGIVIGVGLARELVYLGIETLLLGFFTDLYRPAVSAAVADVVPAERRIRAFGYLYWAINLGAAIAPILGGLMARSSYFLLFAGDAATTLLFGIIVLLRLPETQPAGIRHSRSTVRVPVRRLAMIGEQPVLLLFTGLTFLFAVVYSQCASTLPIAMVRHGVGPSGYGLVISFNGLLIVLLGIPASRAAERWRRFPAVAVASILLGVGFGLGAFGGSLALYSVSVVIWTLGEIVNASVAPAIVAELARPEVQGLFQGIYGSAWGLAFFAGPALGGWIFERFGNAAIWSAAMAVCLLAACGYLLLSRHTDRKSAAGAQI
ncbi:MFS transporter [Salinispira pacifica]